jgi:DNA-binding NtrC family response regulator
MTSHKILIVDDEAGARFGVRDFLESHGYAIEEAESCASAQVQFEASRPDAVVLDYSLPDGNALELLPRLKATDPNVPIVILTGHGTIDLAVNAIRSGADHFLTKPVELTTLLVIVQRLLESGREHRREVAGRKRESRRAVDPFLGTSPAIRRLAEDARRFADSDSPILLQGETGTGKGVLAAWLHRHGPRADEAFVDLNCASLSRELLESELFGHEKGAFTGAATAKQGLFDAAHRGTFFLDEIGDMDQAVQPKLLKVLEEKRFRRVGDVRDRQVDVRLIAATHQDLLQRVQENRFRSDLYYRINTIQLYLPPLRERREDLEVIATRLLERISGDMSRTAPALSEEALHALREYPWPGNIRELRNVLERAVLLCRGPTLTRDDLRFERSASPEIAVGGAMTLAEVERRHIEAVLKEEGGRVEAAAKRLGVPRSSLYERIKRFGIAGRRG